jgi:hypothetical protein
MQSSGFERMIVQFKLKTKNLKPRAFLTDSTSEGKEAVVSIVDLSQPSDLAAEIQIDLWTFQLNLIVAQIGKRHIKALTWTIWQMT